MKVYFLSLFNLRTLKFFLFIMSLATFMSVLKMMRRGNMPDTSLALDQRVKDSSYKVNYFVPVSWKKKDWYNYELLMHELKRKGIGEQGKAAHLPENYHNLQTNMSNMYGLNGALSNEISLARSLPDTRHSNCKETLYVESLPSVSVIIPFRNAHPKTLLRTVYSVINRSPEDLIKEVILVDDASTISELHNITEHSPKIKLVQAKEHKGNIRAKLIGATEATADVLVFLESYSEVNVNWLPPLLEPIALNYRTVVCPVIDIIDNYTFEYRSENEYHRGGFNWQFDYLRLPMRLKDKNKIPEPYENPVMMGGHFAISRIFFWKLGGYDPGLHMWGGEQYELSIKIWQCGGRMITAPCSRVGHINQSLIFLRDEGYFMAKNGPRIAEVWMDDFGKFLKRKYFSNVDIGDISEQKALRTRLHCKPFKRFISEIGFDILLRYPPEETSVLAKGHIKTLEQISEEIYCVQTFNNSKFLTLSYCYASKVFQQDFVLTWLKEIRNKANTLCWDLLDSQSGEKNRVILNKCHGSGGSQEWWYDKKKKNILQGNNGCLGSDIISGTVYVEPCSSVSKTQLWEFDIIHAGLIELWNVNPHDVFEIWNTSLYYDY